ncbi:MAG TPA: tetratricopeptide repeat protein [Nevskia sp.]|nr:tetratricopeptide repeat protein [Nevskia sp.]
MMSYLFSPYYLPILLLQIACAVHVVRSGRDTVWLWIVIIFSFIGCVVYLITQVLPHLGQSPAVRQAKRTASRILDPEGQRRRIEARLALSDTLDNRTALARECMNRGDYGNAADLFRSCLKGMYAHDPAIMLDLARALFAAEDYAATRQTLEELIGKNPDYRSPEGHLLYARALENLGENDQALQEYTVLDSTYPGEEARARHAVLLKRLGRTAEAQTVLTTMRTRFKAAPPFYQRNERSWLDLARRELG